MSREQNIAVVEAYLACFTSKDTSKVPFAEGVVFDMETDRGVDQVCDHIEIADGKIVRVHAFFYPRPTAASA